MLSRLDQTIGEIENMVARRQGMLAWDRGNEPSPWLLDLLFRVPSHATSSVTMVPFDGVWMTVWAGTPQANALDHLGLAMSSVVNPCDDLGTQSVTAEFHNAFLELKWSAMTGSAMERLDLQSEYRTQRRPEDWQRKTEPAALDIEALPGDAVNERPAVFVSASTLAMDREIDARRGRVLAPSLRHPLGVRRVTAVRVVASASHQELGPVERVEKSVMYGLRTGNGWSLEITFDGGMKGRIRDLNPRLPIVFRY